MEPQEHPKQEPQKRMRAWSSDALEDIQGTVIKPTRSSRRPHAPHGTRPGSIRRPAHHPGSPLDRRHAPTKKTAHTVKGPLKSKFGKHEKSRGREEAEIRPPAKPIPPPATDTIRIIPLGGCEGVGKNMTAVEFGGDIFIIDAGFMFPGEESPGVDYIIPDVSYLVERREKIRGIFITHGHLDHIGGLPYFIEKLGMPPIYTRLFGAMMIKKRQAEFPHVPTPDLQIVEKNSRIKAGNTYVRFFNVTHTIPDSMGIIIETPWGNLIFAGDLKVDHIDQVPLPSEVEIYSALGKENNLFMASDSTNTTKGGWSDSETTVRENLREIVKEARGRLFMGTFASLVERVIYVITEAEKMGKKVIIDGRGMRESVEIATELGRVKLQPGTIIPVEDVDKYPENRIVVMATGAQADEYSSLQRMSIKTHKYLKLHKGDTVVLSSSVIPGNEKGVEILKDNLARQGANIIHYRMKDVHSSGHAYADEAKWLYQMIKPRFFMPIHGGHYMLRVHEQVAIGAGIAPENIVVPDNGSIVEITGGGTKIHMLKEKAPADVIMVDGLGDGAGVNEIVIRDRKVLAEDGMFVIIATIDVKTGMLRQSPDIISRGFIYLKESRELLKETRQLIKKTIESVTTDMHPINIDFVKNHVREKTARFLLQKTRKRPIILPVLIEV